MLIKQHNNQNTGNRSESNSVLVIDCYRLSEFVRPIYNAFSRNLNIDIKFQENVNAAFYRMKLCDDNIQHTHTHTHIYDKSYMHPFHERAMQK